ncbi:MAG: XRE family transcriptional regulator, partial [Bacteroidales bacterium]
MEDDVRQRINYVLHVKGYTQNSLSKGDLSIQARLSRQINRGSAITYQTISLILSSFEDISPEWLLT